MKKLLYSILVWVSTFYTDTPPQQARRIHTHPSDSQIREKDKKSFQSLQKIQARITGLEIIIKQLLAQERDNKAITAELSNVHYASCATHDLIDRFKRTIATLNHIMQRQKKYNAEITTLANASESAVAATTSCPTSMHHPINLPQLCTTTQEIYSQPHESETVSAQSSQDYYDYATHQPHSKSNSSLSPQTPLRACAT